MSITATLVLSRPNFNNPSYQGKQLQQVFVIGRKKDEEFSKELLDEMDQYDDFVVGDFVESYLNLTIGLIGLTRWWCHYRLASGVKRFIGEYKTAQPQMLVYSKYPTRFVTRVAVAIWQESSLRLRKPFKSCFLKHISASQYPIGHTYPEFCHGPCMAATAAASQAILAAAKTTNWRSMPVEDVLFNGIMRTVPLTTSLTL